MARGYEIEFITDTRFDGSKAELKKMIKKMQKTGVPVIREGEIRELDWSEENKRIGEKPSKQWRKRYVIGKGNMKWKEVMGKINKIQAPFYKSVNYS